MIYNLGELKPKIDKKTVWIADSADIIGDVVLEANVSVWFNVTIRGDNDTILIYVKPEGPTCHLGTDSCWGEKNLSKFGYLSQLEEIIAERKKDDKKNSYVASLFREGINKIAQKVGEEATETIIEAKDENKQLFLNESADLLFHYLILLQAKGFRLSDVEKVLLTRKR